MALDSLTLHVQHSLPPIHPWILPWTTGSSYHFDGQKHWLSKSLEPSLLRNTPDPFFKNHPSFKTPIGLLLWNWKKGYLQVKVHGWPSPKGRLKKGLIHGVPVPSTFTLVKLAWSASRSNLTAICRQCPRFRGSLHLSVKYLRSDPKTDPFGGGRTKRWGKQTLRSGKPWGFFRAGLKRRIIFPYQKSGKALLDGFPPTNVLLF